MTDHARRKHREPSFAELFTPKLVTVLREGYGAAALRADVLAGLTVAIVALPLSDGDRDRRRADARARAL